LIKATLLSPLLSINLSTAAPIAIGAKLQSMQQRVLLVVLAFALALSAANASRVLSTEDGEQMMLIHLRQLSLVPKLLLLKRWRQSHRKRCC